MVTVLVLALTLKVGTVSAATVDFNAGVDMGTVSIGQTGTITADHFGNLILNKITGSLPANGMITFTYNFAGNLVSGFLAAGSSYSYIDGGSDFAGKSVSIAPLGLSSTNGTVDGFPSTALSVASAQIDFDNNTATSTIKNFSSGVVDYVNLFAGLVLGNKNLEIAYSVSAVPLPAALPLFGIGLAALAGFGARKRKKINAGLLAA
ncbi:MAG: hypothetical protein CO093_06900 [Alphaproteobacteria bacterium CG_4_9_14_3_um_filter_47_13]|nr:MAG: hypothetical protein CO093_06900 [Alphaproteobacteria bacterium CG_4_9_14_3_um_filter_47_13]